MEKLLNLISQRVSAAFEAAGLEKSYGAVTVSNRPDLCEFQCNGALAAAKAYHKPPFVIAEAVVERLDKGDFSMAEVVKPGFINLKLSDAFLQSYVEEMRNAPDFGVNKEPQAKTIVID